LKLYKEHKACNLNRKLHQSKLTIYSLSKNRKTTTLGRTFLMNLSFLSSNKTKMPKQKKITQKFKIKQANNFYSNFLTTFHLTAAPTRNL
jgi:hypothetical protein